MAKVANKSLFRRRPDRLGHNKPDYTLSPQQNPVRPLAETLFSQRRTVGISNPQADFEKVFLSECFPFCLPYQHFRYIRSSVFDIATFLLAVPSLFTESHFQFELRRFHLDIRNKYLVDVFLSERILREYFELILCRQTDRTRFGRTVYEDIATHLADEVGNVLLSHHCI